MTDQKIEEIRARAEKATPGPWGWEDWSQDDGPNTNSLVSASEDLCRIVCDDDALAGEANKSFIAHAREDIPFLLTELDRLKAELAEAVPEKEDAEGAFSDLYYAVTGEEMHLDEGEVHKPYVEKAIATLKASGTFSDGVEAAAKWHEEEANYIADKASFDNADRDGDVRMHLRFARDIRALSPQPRPDAIDPLHYVWMVFFEDTDMKRPAIFKGEGAEDAARKYYAASYANWTCYLFRSIPDAALDAIDAIDAAETTRPDAQAQRERELALIKSACDYVIRFYTAKDWSGPFLGYSDILEAFDRSHHD